MIETLQIDTKSLLQAIYTRQAKIGVIGLGYVGLPLARTFLSAGFRTFGFDIDESKVAVLRRGQTYLKHLSAEWIEETVANETFYPTADFSRLADMDAILICVPTPLTRSRDPDLSYVENTVRSVAGNLRRGQLIILESTTYPGTTRDLVLPALEETGKSLGRDFYLAYSPEREDPGNQSFQTNSIPKVVGGADATSLELAVSLYETAFKQVIPVASCEIAEACKILENTYRAVNIAMVNELKVLFEEMGINIWEVIEAAKTKPFGFQPFYPGPGLGGHCIPVDPFYLTWLARRHELNTRFIELAGEVNTAMPKYVLSRISLALNGHRKPLHGSRICVLGIAYKPNIDDVRESPALRLIELLLNSGAQVSFNDPYVDRIPTTRNYDLPPMTSTSLDPEFLREQDCVVIVTNHSCYDYEFITENTTLVVDTRNATGDLNGRASNVVRA